MRAWLTVVLLAIAAPATAASLDDLAFLEGTWTAEAFGGTIEEVWLPARGDAMHGVFRTESDGAMGFSEFLQVTVEGDDVILRFAHFRPDYTTWEGDGPVMELRVAEAREGYVRFEAINDVTPSVIAYTARGADHLDVEVTGIDGVLAFERAK